MATASANRCSCTIVGDSTGFALAEPRLLQGVTFTNGSILGCGATTGDYYYGDFLRALPPQCSSVESRWTDIARRPAQAILVFLGGWEVFDPERGRTTALGRVRRMA